MAAELIDNIADRGKIQGDVDYIAAKIREIEALIANSKTAGVNIMNATTFKEFNAAQAQATAGQEKLAAATANLSKAQAAQTQATKVQTQALNSQAGSLQQNIELRRRYKNTIESLLKDQKEDAALLRNGTITRAEYNKRLTESQIRIEQYKQGVNDLNKTIKTEINASKEAGNAYKQLSVEYNRAALAAKNYNLTLGANDPLTIQATAKAKQLGDQLKKLDATVGQNQRNVGNYTSSITSAFGKTFSFLKTAANIIPGLGIGGLIGGIAAVVYDLGKNLFTTTARFDRLKESVKALAQVSSETNRLAIENSAGDAAKLEFYRQVITDVTKTQKERTQALNAYNQVADEANQLDIKSINNIGLVNDKITTQIYLLNQRALSRAAESILADRAEKLLLAREAAKLKAEKDINSEMENGNAILVNGAKLTDYAVQLSIQNDIAKRVASDAAVKQAEVEFEASKKNLFGLIDLGKFEAEEDKKKKEKKVKNNKDELKSEIDLFKFRQQLLIDEQKDLVAFGSGTARAIARNKQAELEKELIAGVAAFELKEKDITAEQKLLISEKSLEDQRNVDTKRLLDVERFAIEERKTLLDYAAETQEALNAQQKANDEKAKSELLKSRITSRENEFRAEMRNIQDTTDARSVALLEQYEKGKINKKKYEDEIRKIENDSLEKSIQSQIQYYTDLAFTANVSKDDQTKYILQVEELQKNLDSIRLKRRKENADKEVEIDKEKNEALKKLAGEVANLTFDLFTAGIEQRKNAIQEEIDLLEERKQRDIEIATQSITNAQDRAAAIATIEARAAAQRQQLELRQRQLDQQKAKFDRARSIAQIIANTAQGVTAALATIPPNPVLAAIVGAIGAAQIARVLATPIPKYAHGTDNHPGGYAIMGDAGKREPFVTPDGQVGISASKPTMYDLPAGTIVYPDMNAYSKHIHTAVPEFNASTSINMLPVVSAVKGMGMKVERAIKRIPQPVLKTSGTWERHMRRGNNFTNYINKNL